MSVVVYLYAPRWDQATRFRRRRVRRIKIERVTWSADGKSYTPHGVLYDGLAPCADDAEDRCYVMRGHIESVV